jgi:hypothetical protein
MYNACLKDGCFPKKWKYSVIIFIIKPGKEECNGVSKYRPISLLNVVCFLLGNSPASKFYMSTFWNILFHLHRQVFTYLPMKIEQTECSETSTYKIQAPGNYAEENIQHREHCGSLKSKILLNIGDKLLERVMSDRMIRPLTFEANNLWNVRPTTL